MKVRLIAAMSRNGVIGKKGRLPWSIPEASALGPRTCSSDLVMWGAFVRTSRTSWKQSKVTFASPAEEVMRSLGAQYPAQAESLWGDGGWGPGRWPQAAGPRFVSHQNVFHAGNRSWAVKVEFDMVERPDMELRALLLQACLR